MCNGSTPDSDSVCGGSNPSSSAIKTRYPSGYLVFILGWDSNPFKCRCPVDIYCHQFKNWWLLHNLPPANWQSNPSSSVSAKPMKMKGITLEKSRKPHPPHRLCRCGWGKYIAGNRIPHRQRMHLHPTGVVLLFIGYGIRTHLNADAHWASACCRLGGGNTIDRRQIGNRIPSRHYTFRLFYDKLTKRGHSHE